MSTCPHAGMALQILSLQIEKLEMKLREAQYLHKALCRTIGVQLCDQCGIPTADWEDVPYYGRVGKTCKKRCLKRIKAAQAVLHFDVNAAGTRYTHF